MTSSPPVFNEPCLVVVTGASRGYGLALTKQMISNVGDRSTVVMISRNEEKLRAAHEQAVAAVQQRNIDVRKTTADLSVVADVSKAVSRALDGLDVGVFTKAFLFNNAASLGDVTKTFDALTEPAEVQAYMNLNVVSCMLVTNAFLKRVRDGTPKTTHVVNVSSLLALEPKGGCSLYCTGKAARDMMFRVLALERPDLRVLNWAPGPMPTDMINELMVNRHDEELIAGLKKMVADGSIVKCDESAGKLVGFLGADEFVSGSHVDYFDV